MTGKPNDLPKFSELMPLVIEGLQALGGSASIELRTLFAGRTWPKTSTQKQKRTAYNNS
ncbi:hypothetical protein [Alkalicaulis satelles]|uniref:hypothetical protein n=1 Tax=Alkalicaulis satelles TaxID=2609175 RepID=UPI0018EAB26B|nr:hypothetical protein [Alkalicaulis satelles]